MKRLILSLAFLLCLSGCASYQAHYEAHRTEWDALGMVVDFALGVGALATPDVVGAALSFSNGAVGVGKKIVGE
jgi:hypothetical protein